MHLGVLCNKPSTALLVRFGVGVLVACGPANFLFTELLPAVDPFLKQQGHLSASMPHSLQNNHCVSDCLCVYACVHVFAWMCVRLSVCSSVSVFVCVHVSGCVCVCLCVQVFVCMFVCCVHECLCLR